MPRPRYSRSCRRPLQRILERLHQKKPTRVVQVPRPEPRVRFGLHLPSAAGPYYQPVQPSPQAPLASGGRIGALTAAP